MTTTDCAKLLIELRDEILRQAFAAIQSDLADCRTSDDCRRLLKDIDSFFRTFNQAMHDPNFSGCEE